MIARVARGVYAVGERVGVDPLEATLALHAALSYHSAAAWWGVNLPHLQGEVHVTASRNRGRRKDSVSGVRLHRADLQRDDLYVLRGVLVTSPMRTALDI